MTSKKNESTVTPLFRVRVLEWMQQQNMKPVALRPRSKAALDRKYVDPDYRPPDSSFWTSGDYGIGVLTGANGGGIVDSDLDCEEAIHFGSLYLPPTKAVFGRKSKSRSHYLHRILDSDIPKKAFTDPVTKSTICEIRGDGGHQTVMPSSIHQDTGELIEWSSGGFPETITTVSYETLLKSHQKIALSTLVTKHAWLEGIRNQVNMYLAGMFQRYGWSFEDSEEFLENVRSYLGDDDPTRRRTVTATYRKAENPGAKIAGAGRLRKELKNDPLVDSMLSLIGSPTVGLIEEYNESYAVALYGGRFRVALTKASDEHPGTSQIAFITRDDFIHLTEADTILITNAKGDMRAVSKGKLWLAASRRRAYDRIEFLPGVEEDRAPPGVLNLWTGWARKPDPSGSCEGWLRMVREVISNNDDVLFQWYIQWLANIVREPMNRSFTSPVIMGVPGGGKSLMFLYFGKILGDYYVHVSNPEHIWGKHNRHLATALLLHADEATPAADKRHRSIIKSMITDATLMLEPKNVDAISIPNYLRLAVTSNYMDAAAAEPGERRITANNMEDRVLPGGIRDQVLEEMKGSGPAALLHYLQTIEYAPDICNVNLKNKYLEKLKINTNTPCEAWWHETLDAGELLHNHLHWAQQPEKKPWPQVASSSALYVSFVLWMKRTNRRPIPTAQTFLNDLRRMCKAPLVTRQRNIYENPHLGDHSIDASIRELTDRQMTIDLMPTLQECRTAFESYSGQTIEWSINQDDDEDWKAKRQKEKKDGPQF